MVQASLDRRIAAYHFALERLVIIMPSPQAADAEQVLARLKATALRYRHDAPRARGERVALSN
jgi:hypothetical protein